MAISNSTIQVRVDAKLKKDSKKVLDAIGLDMSSAFKILLRNIVITKSFPLELRTENGFTVGQELAMLAELEDVRKNGQTFDTVEDFLADLKKD